MIYGWMHVGVLGNWRAILAEQVATIEASGLAAASGRVFVGVVGPDADLSWLPPWMTVVRRDGDLRLGEDSTLQALWAWAKERPGGDSLWYVHTKGASHGDNPNVAAWRHYLMDYNVERWRDCAAALDQGYDVAGVDYFAPHSSAATLRRVWRVEVRAPVFVGNFWWATRRYVAGLPPERVRLGEDRWQSEYSFIGMGYPRVRCFAMAAETGNHYVTPPEYPREPMPVPMPVPPEAVAHGLGTETENDLPTLWRLAMTRRPPVVLELGTSRGLSTRTLAHALGHWGGRLVTCDPSDCRESLRGVPCEFVQSRGEDLFATWDGPVTFLYVDTDPHTYTQTVGWLDTWVSSRLGPGGVAVFHDVLAVRPEIQVRPAVLDWLKGQPIGAWTWTEYPGTCGIGVLERAAPG